MKEILKQLNDNLEVQNKLLNLLIQQKKQEMFPRMAQKPIPDSGTANLDNLATERIILALILQSSIIIIINSQCYNYAI